MPKSIVVPKRSVGGCLTCKRRKKKCDEQKPHCKRCIQGDFYCLGYGSSQNDYVNIPSHNTHVGFFHRASHHFTRDVSGSLCSTSLVSLLIVVVIIRVLMELMDRI
ncbi:fungal Zn(2)-cys(6) binuclear cluster domain protein [Rhizoctonia solani AG-3 Rhs1AP]|uniref:Fungal Zn(2)-cys(6) binuclear cluster domain protein n=2 Tax=Rhizoctonia solani AG-3 TaxID=1086053 RepID=A0A074RP16_9AGAM|nr:fungal Zn(2)-cys(6) binuclear cluster domain protein [Rhizoctonia solani AG-3 Rhs1AP]KEP47095.1 fungal Zn(2)-cys(6) binuclear cluster domain protein [Rhizoctonia solani 123E]